MATFALAGCSNDSYVGRDSTPTSGTALATVVAVDTGLPGDPIVVEQLTIAGDTLVARVSHGGGCGDHAYRLVISPSFMESLPVQSRARIAHNANGDMCKALMMRDLRMDLRPLADAYRAQYRQAHGSVSLLVAGVNAAVLYSF